MSEMSVSLSVKRVNCDRTKEAWAHILISRERSFRPILVFWQEEWLVGDNPFYLQLWAKLTTLEQNAAFQVIFSRSTQPKHLVKKSIIAKLRAFQSA